MLTNFKSRYLKWIFSRQGHSQSATNDPALPRMLFQAGLMAINPACGEKVMA